MKKSVVAILGGLVLSAGLAQAQYVRIAPPPPPIEHRAPAPDRRYVWVPGYHRWDEHAHAYHWEGGRWVLPPRPHAYWVAGRWESRPGGYVWVPGRWRD
jgi:hypothetical protein